MSERSNDDLADKLDHVSAQLDVLIARQRLVEETIDELLPIARVAMAGAVETLDRVERAGYFTFAREALRVLDRVVSAYSPDDVRRLGDQVVAIVDTVRNLTQSDMLAMMNEVAGVVHDADDADPKGMWGLVRAGKDPDVRKGIGLAVAVLKQVGKAADAIARHPPAAPLVRLAAYQGPPGEGPPAWVRHLAPRRARPVAVAPEPASAPQSTVVLPKGYGPDGFLVDPATWTRELALEVAALVPLSLTDLHWQVLTWARNEHATTGTSPNVRKVALGSGVSVRELYTLFPGKPGILIAMLAGIPKPAGCL